jgi:hypothetical protein
MRDRDVPQQATSVASAKNESVHLNLKLASERLKPRAHPMVVAMTPEDAMALSIQLQKAAIDARSRELRRTA